MGDDATVDEEADDTSQTDDATTDDTTVDDKNQTFEGRVTQKAFLFGPAGDVLVTRSGDHWSVPGGKFEYGETMQGGLRRELREELSVDARIGPPVATNYGAWLDGSGDPLVTLFYRATTDDRDVTPNDEHDEAEWVEPAVARDRLASVFGRRVERALARAVAVHTASDEVDDLASSDGFDDVDPFVARADPFEGCETTREEWLAYTTDAREMSLDELREAYD